MKMYKSFQGETDTMAEDSGIRKKRLGRFAKTLSLVVLGLVLTEGMFTVGATLRYYKEKGSINPIEAWKTYPIGLARLIYGPGERKVEK